MKPDASYAEYFLAKFFTFAYFAGWFSIAYYLMGLPQTVAAGAATVAVVHWLVVEAAA